MFKMWAIYFKKCISVFNPVITVCVCVCVFFFKLKKVLEHDEAAPLNKFIPILDPPTS